MGHSLVIVQVIVLTPAEANRLDDWANQNKIASREEACRILILEAIELEQNAPVSSFAYGS